MQVPSEWLDSQSQEEPEALGTAPAAFPYVSSSGLAAPVPASHAGGRYIPPVRRPLRVFAFDPMVARLSGHAQEELVVEVHNERLLSGPHGDQIAVIDYDGAHKCYYPPIDLDKPAVLMQRGLDPTESDPRFHQQMVYAVAMKTIENFERALGRRLRLGRNRSTPLRLFPHAFLGANAYFDPDLNAVLFGYFQASHDDPGPNLPNQVVFSCLSQDIIAHEMTHAIVHRLRRYFIEPTNADVFAFHEGIADVVAIFQHFSFQDILRNVIQSTRTKLHEPTALIGLAQQFGYATGQGAALRSAGDPSKTPDRGLYATALEPHERGAILVAAVFDAFFATYQRRIRDLVRIATGGTGTLPDGDLHPDLVNRIAIEAATNAQYILTMCIRAFEYLPPVDVTFGDFLRAMVTADFELVSSDPVGQRGAMIEAFRERGIYPDGVSSLAEDSLRWPDHRWSSRPPLPTTTGRYAQAFDPESSEEEDDAPPILSTPERNDWAAALKLYADQNDLLLGLDAHSLHKIRLVGFHPVFRVSPDGSLLTENVVQFVQQSELPNGANPSELGGVPFLGGATVIAAANGKVRYIVSKPVYSPRLDAAQQNEAQVRFERQSRLVEEYDLLDPNLAWGDQAYLEQRMKRRLNFALIHQHSAARRRSRS
jgi:hypothetical protein